MLGGHDLRLKTDFHHICGLSQGHSQATCCTTRKQTTANANIWIGETWISILIWAGLLEVNYFKSQILTIRSFSVELFNRVVETDTDRGKAHLSLKSCNQPTVKTQSPLSAHYGDDGTKHTPILYCRNFPHYFRDAGLSLDLCREQKISSWLILGQTKAFDLKYVELNFNIPAAALLQCPRGRWAGPQCRLQFLHPQTLQLLLEAHPQAEIQPFFQFFYFILKNIQEQLVYMDWKSEKSEMKHIPLVQVKLKICSILPNRIVLCMWWMMLLSFIFIYPYTVHEQKMMELFILTFTVSVSETEKLKIKILWRCPFGWTLFQL